jgi:asparagine synthase (glutamine-hydrolysing)
MLRAQQMYARGQPAYLELPGLCIGRALWPTVPEDRFDRGPITDSSGRWTLAADVRLDDRDTFAAEVGLNPSEAGKLADAELVMSAVERWGSDAIPPIIGDFALILWDGREQRLILARDFQGRRPLHYHSGSGFVAVSSMPKGVLALSEVQPGPDAEVVEQFLALLPERTPRSFFADVERVLPGEIVEIAPDQRLARRSYWDFKPKPLKLRDEEYVEAVRETFDKAVAARLRGAGSIVGAHLSGGLDSTSVAATAARLIGPGGQVFGFTASPREGSISRNITGRFNDETDHAASVAALYPNMEHVVLRGSGQSPLAALDRNFFLHDRPVLNLCNSVWLDGILDAAKERNLSVLLTGEFGNMTFSYPGLEGLAELVLRGDFLRLAREAMLLPRHGTRLISAIAHSVGPFLPKRAWLAMNRAAGRYLDVRDYAAVKTERVADIEREAVSRHSDSSCRPWRSSLDLRKWVLSMIDDGNFLKGNLAGWGVDVRDPTVDRRLVELCLSIPADQYLKNGQIRWIARRAFADRLPPLIINERRKGYQASDWHEGLQNAWAEAATEAQRIAALPCAGAVIDTHRLTDLLAREDNVEWTSARAATDYRLALLRGLSAGHFLRKASGANC